MRYKTIRATALIAVGVVALAACSSSSKSASSGSGGASGSSSASGAPITLGYITSLSGAAASSYGESGVDGARARVDQVNAAGGVNGHMIKLEVADDQSTPTGNATAAKSLVETKNAFAVIDESPLAFGGAPYLNQKGIPVTGDGNAPQYTQKGFNNMFSYQPPTQQSVFDGKSYTWSDLGKFFKAAGATKLATESIGALPGGKTFSETALASAASQGVTKCLENLAIPLGGVDFTAPVLAVKNAGCDSVYSVLTSASNQALVTALDQANVKVTALLLGAYNPDTIATSASASAFEGAWTSTPVYFDTTANPGAKPMIAALVKYAPGFKEDDVPSNGMYSSYLDVDLALKGLQVAGANPTRESFIANLQKVTDYDAGGIMPSTTTFAHFGTVDAIPEQHCDYFLQIKGGKFVDSAPGGKICGTRIATS